MPNRRRYLPHCDRPPWLIYRDNRPLFCSPKKRRGCPHSSPTQDLSFDATTSYDLAELPSNFYLQLQNNASVCLPKRCLKLTTPQESSIRCLLLNMNGLFLEKEGPSELADLSAFLDKNGWNFLALVRQK